MIDDDLKRFDAEALIYRDRLTGDDLRDAIEAFEEDDGDERDVPMRRRHYPRGW